MKKYLVLFLLVVGLLFPKQVFATSENQFVTIVNPVRISKYNNEPGASLLSEYSVIKDKKLPATWLLTYDALIHLDIKKVASQFNSQQELGIFLEVTPAFAQAAGVEYNKTDFWYHANALFLSGYTQAERKLLIDKVFEVFKNGYGHYPVSVGSWWTDSYSLAYMQEKYGIVANLGCADQFATDNYKIWGTYWSAPYYPSRDHAGLPGYDAESQIKVVNMQWAARDPLNGYRSSAYSTQDYLILGKNLQTPYFKKLVELFTERKGNQFGQIVVGLEADLSPVTYKGEYSNQMETIAVLSKEDKVQTVIMKDFGNWYQKQFETTSPITIKEGDLLGETNQSVAWYQSKQYRIGYIYDPNKEIIKIIDLRVYPKGFQEPYFLSPNGDKTLSIQIPSVLDSINNEEAYWEFSGNPEIIHFFEDRFEIDKRLEIPSNLLKNKMIKIQSDAKKTQIFLQSIWPYEKEGLIYEDYSAEAKHFFGSKKFIFSLIRGRGWEYFQKVKYLIPTGELEALNVLANLPEGSIMVFDNECLQCEYQSTFKPPAFSNVRNYVGRLSGKRIVSNKSVFLAKEQSEARREFRKLKAKYVYLVKFENYFEKLPFSPGDLGVKKIYDNANSEIWMVEKI